MIGAGELIYCGEYDHPVWHELAGEHVDAGYYGPVPAELVGFIDYDAIGRDIEHSGRYTLIERPGGAHVWERCY